MRFGLGGASIGVGVVAGIARNKWVAWHLGTAGVGVVGQMTAAQTWLGVTAALGLSLAITRMASAALAQGDEDRARRIVWTAGLASGLAAAIAVAFAMAFAPRIASALLGDPSYAPLVRIAALGGAGYALYSLTTGLLAARSDVVAPLTLALAGGLAGVAITFALVPAHGPAGAVIAIAAMLPLGVAGALLVHRRAYAPLLVPRRRPVFDRTLIRPLLGIGAGAMALAIVDQGALLGARADFVHRHGVAPNGLFQAALALTQQVGGVFYSYLANYAFGRVSGLGHVDAMRDYTHRQWRPLMLLAAAAFALAMLLAGPLLHLLYSDRFDPARAMVSWMLVGEFARVAMQCWAVASLPIGGVALWLPLMLSFPLGLLVGYAACLGMGVNALAYAYAIAGGVSLLVVAVGMSLARVRLSLADLGLLLATLGGLALLAWRQSA
ncbi:MAG TPA: MATE family efflux transporter [Candidatus Acidoferrales bacterium]|nr:MATE family efflux transporter [Candidatus Acidoferrales bacterium]